MASEDNLSKRLGSVGLEDDSDLMVIGIDFGTT